MNNNGHGLEIFRQRLYKGIDELKEPAYFGVDAGEYPKVDNQSHKELEKIAIACYDHRTNTVSVVKDWTYQVPIHEAGHVVHYWRNPGIFSPPKVIEGYICTEFVASYAEDIVIEMSRSQMPESDARKVLVDAADVKFEEAQIFPFLINNWVAQLAKAAYTLHGDARLKPAADACSVRELLLAVA